MKGKKIIGLCTILFTLFNFTACETNDTKESTSGLFDTQRALSISKDFLSNIKSGNIEGANKLCSEELIMENVNIGEGISKITSFDKEKSIVGSDFAYYVYNVIRTSSIAPKSDLESLTIKVEKIDDEYLINEVKAQSKKELFVEGDYLRILEDQGSNSNLVVSLTSIPKDTYTSENKMMLYKSEVPNDNFGTVGLSFTGKKVAISTIGQNKAYICVANIEDSLSTSAEQGESAGQSSSSDSMSQLESLFEKPIAKKIISLDLLDGSTINNFIFSKKEDSLAVSYTNGNGVKRVSIYNANEGNMLSKNLNKEFDESQYNIDEIGFNAEEFVFNVTRVSNDIGDIEKEGKYSFNIESSEIKKL